MDKKKHTRVIFETQRTKPNSMNVVVNFSVGTLTGTVLVPWGASLNDWQHTTAHKVQ